jgi:hypothetical protein
MVSCRIFTLGITVTALESQRKKLTIFWTTSVPHALVTAAGLVEVNDTLLEIRLMRTSPATASLRRKW